MSKERELLSWMIDAYDSSDGNEFLYALEEARTFLAAEPEVEYDLSEVIPLTHRKAKGIIKDRGYNVTGFVLTRKDGDKCIVDMSAVRWLTDKEFFEMMHPPVVSPTAEPARKPMSEEEIDEEIATNEHYCERSFAEGVRWAEKHHFGIGGSDE